MITVMESHIVGPMLCTQWATSKLQLQKAQRQILNLDTLMQQLSPCPEFLQLFAVVACGAWLVLGT